jgi:hypothetical protein
MRRRSSRHTFTRTVAENVGFLIAVLVALGLVVFGRP